MTVKINKEKIKKLYGNKKYQVEIMFNDEVKFLYIDDLTMLDEFCRSLQASVIEIVDLK